MTGSGGHAAAAEAAVNTSNHVYVKSRDFAWVPARVLETDDTTATAVVSVPVYKDEQAIQSDGGRGATKFEMTTVNLTDYPSGALLLQNVDEEGHLRQVDDMVDLPFLHEASSKCRLMDSCAFVFAFLLYFVISQSPCPFSF